MKKKQRPNEDSFSVSAIYPLKHQQLAYCKTIIVQPKNYFFEENDKIQQRETCPCCGYKTLEKRYEYESYPICRWMDDDIQEDLPDLAGGANKVSLREAQKNFKEIEKCSRLFLKNMDESKLILPYEKDENGKPLD